MNDDFTHTEDKAAAEEKMVDDAFQHLLDTYQIGRASCRERVCVIV